MKISAIQDALENSNSRKFNFIRYSNHFMSAPSIESPIEKANKINPAKPVKMGIENLEEFTIFPKEIKDGKTIITA